MSKTTTFMTFRGNNSINSFYWSLETIGRCHAAPVPLLNDFVGDWVSLQSITLRCVWMKNEPDGMAESALSAINFVCTSNESHHRLMQFMQFDVDEEVSHFSRFRPDRFAFNYRLVKLCWKSAKCGGVFEGKHWTVLSAIVVVSLIRHQRMRKWLGDRKCKQLFVQCEVQWVARFCDWLHSVSEHFFRLFSVDGKMWKSK